MKFFGFKALAVAAMLFIPAAVATVTVAQEPQKPPTPEEMAAKEADRLAELLDLEGWQTFYVDSTLQHDYTAWQAEMERLQKLRVDNMDMYTAVRDKWMDQIDKTYETFFTEQQWAAYLKSGAAKAQKARAKRRAKIEKATSGLMRP